MFKRLTVGELRKALQGVPDETIVKLSSDTGVDQGCGEVVVEDAYHMHYVFGDTTNLKMIDNFIIYCNDRGTEDDWVECEKCNHSSYCKNSGCGGCYEGERNEDT